MLRCAQPVRVTRGKPDSCLLSRRQGSAQLSVVCPATRRQFVAGLGVLLLAAPQRVVAQQIDLAASVPSSLSPASSAADPATGTLAEQSPVPTPAPAVPVPKDYSLTNESVQRYLKEEEDRRRKTRKGSGRLVELEEIRTQLVEKQLILLEKEAELLQKEQTVIVLQEELDLERKLRALLTKEKEKAEEEAALAMGLCTGGAMLP